MCFTRLQHFVCFSLFLCTVYYDSFHLNISVYSTALNNSEEIKNIFRDFHASNHTHKQHIKGPEPVENFAEGGLAPAVTSTIFSTVVPTSLKGTTSKLIKETKTSSNNTGVSSTLYITENQTSTSTPCYKFSSLTKLNETETNLFLGVPEVIHVNGTSSIKPRKGVFYNKIVPRKGVDNDNETIHSFSNNHSCFWISQEECYSADDFSNTNCSCCKEGNVLGETIKEQTLLNCGNCTPVTPHPLGDKINCEKICCVNVSNDQDISAKSSVENNASARGDNIKKNKSQIKSLENHSSKRLLLDKDRINVSVASKTKSKPTITKVPYDFDYSDRLVESRKQVFVPIIVSVFILPLLGILAFLIWRRTKEFWEKRYYKRMDFLIDGMYND